MGCCGSKKETPEETRKPYSWETREQIDPNDYTFDGIVNETVVRKQGSINGQPFVIKDCKDAKIFLLDAIATITIDDCSNCQFIIGPTKGSIFIRDCHDCKLICACQQFRTRDCTKIDTFLHCTTQPIIESSCKMKFGCYQLAYDGLEKQFTDSLLSIFNNSWYNIHDFTPVTESKNWMLVNEHVLIHDLFDLKSISDKDAASGNGDNEENEIEKTSLSAVSCNDSVIPLTRGSRERNFSESCLVLLFSSDNSVQTAFRLIATMKAKTQLIQTKEVTLSPDEIKRIISEQHLMKDWKTIRDGPVVGLEFNGEDCVNVCRKAVEQLEQESPTMYVSPSSDAARTEADSFYNFCDMRMSV
uniref:Protein XRP2 n=1 Tax=Phallusia mammillata TaxID=59560 RepID=A0A6F9DRT4_9ASCI|nr:protein XRP2-like [Phallusia mammillata]